VQKEEKLFESLEKRPPRQKADATIGKNISVDFSTIFVEVQRLLLGLGQQLFVVLFVEGDRRAVDLFPRGQRQHERRAESGRTGRLCWPTLTKEKSEFQSF